MFQVKICGITSEEDALAAIRSGADAIGLNFYPRSRRYVPPAVAQDIVSAVGGQAASVGVFVDTNVRTIEEAAAKLQLDFIQLHGNESPEVLRDIQLRPIIRAYRYSKDRVSQIKDDLTRCRALSASPAAVLLDAFHPTEFGGTGLAIDWGSLGDVREVVNDLPFILAGGLNPDNVAQAIRESRPNAVDVASGVELAPRRKDEALMNNFVRSAIAAFAAG